jgi:hypothetical protein
MVHQKVKMQQWKEGKKDFSDYCLAEKVCIFRQKGIAKNVQERAMPERNAQRVNCKN